MNTTTIDTTINGCPCIARVQHEPPRRGVCRGEPVFDPGSLDIQLFWMRGGRARALEGKMTADDLDRIADQAQDRANYNPQGY